MYYLLVNFRSKRELFIFVLAYVDRPTRFDRKHLRKTQCLHPEVIVSIGT